MSREASFLDPENLPADDRGLLLGDGLFETVRLYRGCPFRLQRHLDRLRAGADTVGIEVPDDLAARVERAIEGWSGRDAALRITLTRGSGSGLAPPDVGMGTLGARVFLQLRDWADDPAVLREGLSAKLCGRIDEGALTAGIKCLGYLERIQALRVARAAGADEALLRNTRGRVVEGSASNLYVVLDDRIVAPGANEGALEGITREVLLSVAETHGRTIEARGVEVDEIRAAREVVLSSSLRGVVAVTEIDGGTIGDGTPGPVCREFTSGLSEIVSREVGGF